MVKNVCSGHFSLIIDSNIEAAKDRQKKLKETKCNGAYYCGLDSYNLTISIRAYMESGYDTPHYETHLGSLTPLFFIGSIIFMEQVQLTQGFQNLGTVVLMILWKV